MTIEDAAIPLILPKHYFNWVSGCRKSGKHPNSTDKEFFWMSEIDGEKLNQILKNQNAVYVLFYATWCPFSQRFLPIYTKCTSNYSTPCARIAVDNLPEICEKYSIEVYPTVLLFQNGSVAKRLDGEHGAGLNENQLKKLLNAR
jgi:thioredoxin-like negative regulator of GroEL